MPIGIDREEVQRLVAGGAYLFEVLPAEDFVPEHLPGAINIPLKKLERTSIARFDRDAAIVVYCWDAR